MTIELDGGCRVSRLREGSCIERDGLRMWPRIGRATGAVDISLRVLEFPPGRSPPLHNPDCDDVLFVLSGRARADVNGEALSLQPDDGCYLAPGSTLAIDNPGPEPLVLASSRCPDPGERLELAPSPRRERSRGPSPLVHLADQAAETTGDRWYRVLVGAGQGSHAVTQFVGSIPPSRMPEHAHTYEEVLLILRGEGVMWAGTSHAPIEAGCCIFLPRRQPHSVENTGRDALVLLGVFYPAGSPAARYDT